MAAVGGKPDAFLSDVYAVHASKDNFRPQGATTVTLAFERSRFPVLADRLRSAVSASDEAVILNALQRCQRLLPGPGACREAVDAGLVSLLADMHRSSIVESRRRSAASLRDIFS